MWSTVPAVQVLSYRMLKKLGNQDLLDMMYLEDDVRAWAEAGISKIDDSIVHKDSNGVILNAGDTVTIIKDLEVKGAGFTAKRGTAVRNISLTSNPDQIEGRVNGVKIVLLTQYLKKS
jgi:protein PhnA